MKYARLGVDKIDATDINRNIVPNGQEFTCINPRCECIYYFRNGNDRANSFYRKTGEEHTNGCTIGFFDKIQTIPPPIEISVGGGTNRRSDWSSSTINSIAQLYDYYSNFELSTPLSEVDTRLKSEFIIDNDNLLDDINDEIYLIKFVTNVYYTEKNQIKGYCGNRKVTFNFLNNTAFLNVVNEILALENGFSGYEMYYLGRLNYYENSGLYFLHSASHNFEILLG